MDGRFKRIACATAFVVVGVPLDAQEPWARVPPLPTACYEEQDHFLRAAAAAKEALTAASASQSAENGRIQEAWNGLDEQARQDRLMTLLLSNPADASRFAQQMQEASELASPPQGGAEFDARRERLVAEIVGELQRLPPMTEDPSWPSAFNRAYADACKKWFTGGAGAKQIDSYLSQYREYLTREYIPWYEQHEAAVRKFYQSMQVPGAANLRSTAAYDAVVLYLSAASQFYDLREEEPKRSP